MPSAGDLLHQGVISYQALERGLNRAAKAVGAYRDPNRPLGQTLYDAASGAMMAAPAEGGGEAALDAIAPRYNSIADAPRIAPDKATARDVARQVWAQHGRPLDFDDLPDSVWSKQTDIWNKNNPDNQVPDVTKEEGATIPGTHPFMDYIDKTLLEGNKAPFPGLKGHNDLFESWGDLQHAVYAGKLPRDIRAEFKGTAPSLPGNEGPPEGGGAP